VQLDDRSALDVLMELFRSQPPDEQDLIRTALHIGIATTEFKSPLEQGDFLIRHVINIDQERGTIGVDESIRNGQTVQFHLRHSEAATEDLELMLGNYQNEKPATDPAGALLFSCTGRGAFLFGQPNHDSDAFASKLGNLPVGGFFCAGEIGQVGGSTYMHGYTSSFGIFRPEHT
jgi:small ligand-binding sensory domain FIST